MSTNAQFVLTTKKYCAKINLSNKLIAFPVGVLMRIKMRKEEKVSFLLFIGCWFMYEIVRMTKNAFGASMASIIGEGLFTKSLAGTINASYYIFTGEHSSSL